MTISIGQAERLADARADTALHWAEIAGKRVFILRQVGSFPDISYDHGRILASQVTDGVFPEIIDTIRTGTDVGSDLGDRVITSVYRRLSHDVFEACSDEFRQAIDAMGEGLLAETGGGRFTAQDVRDALVAIDVGNLADGLTHRMAKPLAPEVSGTIGYVIGAIRKFPTRTDEGDDSDPSRDDVSRAVRRLRAPARQIGFGCTAVGAAPLETEDGLGLHARTFDGAFFDWNNWPGLFIVDERGTNPDWHRYVAVGTAGLIYSGGISGLNDQGLACSIHQMSTGNYDTGTGRGDYAVAPYLQQRILREAASLAEAEQILRGTKHFASWTIVVSDAKAGRAARFEISGGTQRVRRMDLSPVFSQSNHFLHHDMAERHDYFGDTHFTPTFGKWLESRARLETVAAAVAKGGLGTGFAISLLGSHADGAIGGAPRSFGRTICKAYGLMGSIARCDPDRTRAMDQIWMSVGDARPGPHAHFAGFAIDWDALEVTPVPDTPVRRSDAHSDEFTASLTDYVNAFAAVSRPRGPDGSYLGRDPTEAEERALQEDALVLIDRACNRVEDAGEVDVPLRYVRARLRHELGEFEDAARDWAFLRELFNVSGIPLHDWDKTLIMILSAATHYEMRLLESAQQQLAEGRKMLLQIRRRYFADGPTHPDLHAWEQVCEALWTKGSAELPYIDFVTVE
ncbi:MAG: carcinine hydrolase/isopenicillin-N N-acyltransferase family protein [Pseudomonadota bacterium]